MIGAMFSDLNKKQQEAVYAGEGPLLIVAGAGSGKTKTLTSRLAFLIAEKKISPQRILAITFTNKAAEEMKLRALRMISDIGWVGDEGPFLGTFHSFGARILRKEARRFSRTSAFSIFDKDDSLRVIKRILKNRSLQKPTAPALLKHISRRKSECEGPVEDDFSLESALYDDHEKELERQNAFDFDDLIEKPVRLFLSHPEILKKYQSQFDYILVDEYQDINSAQYQLVKLLSSHHQNVNVVGDDQQSIYGFRFSDFRNFLNFEKDWEKARVVMLEQNYRSTRHIIEASSALIARNTFQKTKTLWTENEEGERIRVVEQADEFSEADFVTDKARKLYDRGWSVGILFRTNAQSRALEQAFLEKNIPYTLFGALSFYERKEIKDVTAALRYAANPKDEISFLRLENEFSKKISGDLARELPLLTKELPAKILEKFLSLTDYAQYLKKNYPNASDRMENVLELLSFSRQFWDLPKLLEKITLVNPLDDYGKRKAKKDTTRGISMMTIHLSKGLEFDGVLLTGANEGILPHQRSLGSQEDMEEERRLMYVAMTRARKELWLNFFGVPSRFLYELPPEKVDFLVDRPLSDDERYIEYD